MTMTQMFSTEETDLREGTMVGLGDIGLIIDDMDDDDIMLSDAITTNI